MINSKFLQIEVKKLTDFKKIIMIHLSKVDIQ